MSGFRNYTRYLYKHVIMIEKCETKGVLYHIDDYDCPALVKGNNTVVGELITYNDDCNNSVELLLDKLENIFEFKSCGNKLLYEKRSIVVNKNGLLLQADAYICRNVFKHKHTYVECGDWRIFKYEKN